MLGYPYIDKYILVQLSTQDMISLKFVCKAVYDRVKKYYKDSTNFKPSLYDDIFNSTMDDWAEIYGDVDTVGTIDDKGYYDQDQDGQSEYDYNNDQGCIFGIYLDIIDTDNQIFKNLNLIKAICFQSKGNTFYLLSDNTVTFEDKTTKKLCMSYLDINGILYRDNQRDSESDSDDLGIKLEALNSYDYQKNNSREYVVDNDDYCDYVDNDDFDTHNYYK